MSAQKHPKTFEKTIAEELGIEIFNTIDRLKGNGNIKISLFLGVADDMPEIWKIEEKVLALKYFKKDGAVKSFTTQLHTDIQHHPEIGEIGIDVVHADCELDAATFTNYVRESLSHRVGYCRMLADKYLKILRIVEAYFQPPLVRDEKLNGYFLHLTKEFDNVLDRNIFPGQNDDWLPFSNLLGAEEEARVKWLSRQRILARMNAYYGRIHKTLSHYDLSPAQESQDNIDAYLQKVFRDKTAQSEYHPKQKLTQPLPVVLMSGSTVTVVKEIRRVIPQKKSGEPFVGPLKIEKKTGDLAYYNDGSIRFRGQNLPMRAQLKDICRLFINRPNQLITSDDIYDVLEKAIPKNTISKYVSELHSILRSSYGRDVLISEKKSGWKFNP